MSTARGQSVLLQPALPSEWGVPGRTHNKATGRKLVPYFPAQWFSAGGDFDPPRGHLVVTPEGSVLHLLIVGGGKGGAKEPTVLMHAVPRQEGPERVGGHSMPPQG